MNTWIWVVKEEGWIWEELGEEGEYDQNTVCEIIKE